MRHLIQGLNSLVDKSIDLIRSFGTVVAVLEEGLYVDVVLDHYTLGNETLSNIPVLQNPYLNLPIREGDKVFLTTTSHLLGEYFQVGGFLNYIGIENYIAIPNILQPLRESKEFGNHFTYLNPEMTYRYLINDSKVEITGETIDKIVKLQSSKQEFSQNYEIQCDSYKLQVNSSADCNAQDISIEANSSLKLNSSSIDLGSSSVKIGQLIGQMIDALTSSTTTTVGGPSTQTGQTLDGGAIGTLNSVKSQLQSVFK